jgi:hypothetical protein
MMRFPDRLQFVRSVPKSNVNPFFVAMPSSSLQPHLGRLTKGRGPRPAPSKNGLQQVLSSRNAFPLSNLNQGEFDPK